MLFRIPSWLDPFDHTVLWLLAPLAIVFVISGLDDLAIDLAWIYARIRQNLTHTRPSAWRRDLAPPRPIAILVPLWHEHEVIASMLEHNVESIRYPNFHIFAGAYPNDPLTQNAIRGVAERFSNVHLAVCPHNGPTSKADCLNWIYQHVCIFEEQSRLRFEVIVTHDAEDLIHPDELRWINFYASWYDFIQVPVLALATPLKAITHGIYCDEFAEFHTRDMAVRSAFRCFIPSSGVGTGYYRPALEDLAALSSNRLFEPSSLTEDYENGLRMYRIGCLQTFLPVFRAEAGRRDYVATREYFPHTWRAALRQRTRWVMGIALQGWQNHGWRGSLSEMYWFWRDRKGLIASPLGALANGIFVYGLATHIWTRTTPLDSKLTMATLALQLIRLAVRMMCVARIYGFVFSLGVPVRALYANALNASATILAITRYFVARIRHQPLRWVKTDHAYPSQVALAEHRHLLGEILTDWGELTNVALKRALATKPAHMRLGEYLVRLGEIHERRLYEALSAQQGLPLASFELATLQRGIARALPKSVAREWKVLPFKIIEGTLLVASPELPSSEMTAAVRSHTSLEIHFHLVTPSEFERATTALL